MSDIVLQLVLHDIRNCEEASERARETIVRRRHALCIIVITLILIQLVHKGHASRSSSGSIH
jgi:hypothetical protein